MLQDLPIELLECILLRAVAMEVKGLKLAKSVWKQKADLVMSRLTTVCSQWRNVLTTDFFRNELHRILDGTAQETIRFEVLHEFRIRSEIHDVATMKDEIFMLYRPRRDKDAASAIHVYDRNNRAEVKDVIPLPGTYPVCLAACDVSDCVYVGLENKIYYCISVLRISKDGEHQFQISPWIKDHRGCISTISVSANGNLIILSVQQGWGNPDVVSIYDASGSLQHEIMLSPDIVAPSYKNVIQKSNGNLVLAYSNEEIKLVEIDAGGSIVRRYQSSYRREGFVNVADIYGRIMIAEPFSEVELLDSEFNLLGTYSLQQDEGKKLFISDLHYDSERNEIVRIHFDWKTGPAVTIFRLAEE